MNKEHESLEAVHTHTHTHTHTNDLRKEKGITLVALVVTIVVLLILAGVTINLVVGQNGLINRAKEAAQKTKNATESEMQGMDDLSTQLAALSNTRSVFEGGNWNSTLGICTPKLGNNMVGVYWSDGSKNDNGTYKASLTSTAIEITSDQEGFSWNDWYNYRAEITEKLDSKQSRWANAKSTVDGSYFVWIPRYEYKILSGEHTSTAGKIDVQFINNNITTATKEGYKVHLAFTTNLALGGWDKEISGIWVAKYEMSMEQTTDNGKTWNNIKLKSGNVSLSNTTRAASKPNNYSWNYINISNCFDNSLNYSSKQNTGANSHLMKNSEWGAIAYLTHSQYGRNGNEIGMNTYGPETKEGETTYYNEVTGYGSSGTGRTTEENIAEDNRYNGKYGMNASTTGNLYGVYDISGGCWEYTSVLYSKYTNNNGNSLYAKTANGKYSSSVADSQIPSNSSKYVTIYPIDTTVEGNDGSIHFHYAKWKDIYGDAIYETSNGNGNTKSWFNNNADPDTDAIEGPFSVRGGYFWIGAGAGAFAFGDGHGYATYSCSYRIVLICE